MKLNVLKWLGVLVVLFVSIIAKAEVPNWQIIPKESSLTFTATQNGAPVSGTFQTFTGDISFDPAALNASHVKIVVDIASVTTSYKELEDTLKTADWFDSKLFPQAVFTANEFTKTGNNTYDAKGMLTIRNKTLPVTLKFTLDEFSSTHAKVKGVATLKRTSFGVGRGDWAKTDEVKDDVQVNFVLTAKH